MVKSLFLTTFALLLLPYCTMAAKPVDYKKNVDVKKVDHKGSYQVVIDRIPHVKQKGSYCVPATCSMILRYFDSRYYQKDLGKLFGSSRKDGTNLGKFYRAFQSSELAEGFTIRNIYSLNANEVFELKKACNDARVTLSKNPKKLKKFKKLKRIKKYKKPIPADNHFAGMDPLLVTQVIPRHRVKLRQTLNTQCRKYIDSGIPVIWSVDLLLDPTVNNTGGHMRIINGYVIKNKEITHIIYRDSWQGHSNGRTMSIDQALTITKHLYVVTPKK